MINRLYVFANMGKLDRLPKSGGQSSARRVMSDFESEGINIVPIRRHRAELQTRIGHVFEISYFAIYDLLKMIYKMIFGRRKNSAFMQMTYAGALVPYELILTITARIMGFKCVEYLQGGKVMDTYPAGSKLHKWLFKKNIELQDTVYFEGYDALKLVEKITNKCKLVYFPSYIRDEIIPTSCPKKSKTEINLCYFGRVSKQKNILLIIDIFNIVSKKLKQRVTLTIIGGSDNLSYRENVIDAIKNSQFKDNIKLMDITPYSEIKNILEGQHFFLFPTITKAEGHSNSLNEAMSMGVIPIVSNLHFNATIVGNTKLVVNSYTPGDYANVILNIINSDEVETLSAEIWNRLKEKYSYSNVRMNISNSVKNL